MTLLTWAILIAVATALLAPLLRRTRREAEEPKEENTALPPIAVEGIGELPWDAEWQCYEGGPVALAALGGAPCRVRFFGYEVDPSPADFHRAIAAFLALGSDTLKTAEPHVRSYHLDHAEDDLAWDETAGELIARPREHPADIWKLVSFGGVTVQRRHYGDQAVYASVSAGCDWEGERGLVLVFREGAVLSRVSGHDGHLSWADAYGDPKLEGVVYPPLRTADD